MAADLRRTGLRRVRGDLVLDDHDPAARCERSMYFPQYEGGIDHVVKHQSEKRDVQLAVGDR